MGLLEFERVLITWSSGGDGGVGGAAAAVWMFTWFGPQIGGSDLESSRRSCAASVSSFVWSLSSPDDVRGIGTVGSRCFTGTECLWFIWTGSNGGEGEDVDEGGEKDEGGWGLMLARISMGSGVVRGGVKVEKLGSSLIFLLSVDDGSIIDSWSGGVATCWRWPANN